MIDSRTAPYAALVMRLALGIMFIAHGLTKVFVFTPAGTAAFFQSVGFPGFLAYPIMAFEVIGGLMLVLGIYARWVAAVAVVQLFAAATVHFGNGWSFTNANGGWEYPIYLSATALVLALLGDGAFAVKRSISYKFNATRPLPNEDGGIEISRRKIIAGLAVSGAGALLASGYVGTRKVKSYMENHDGTPEKSRVEPATVDTQRLAAQLRGVWQLQLTGSAADLDDLMPEGMEMFLDVADRGRSLRGYIDTPENLRGPHPPRYQVMGDLGDASAAQIHWLVLDRDSVRASPIYHATVALESLWAKFGVADNDILKGRFECLDRPAATGPTEVETFDFIGRKLPFPEARERVPLNAAFLGWLMMPEHRLAHQIWHASRDKWHELSEDRRDALRGLGWQPGPLDNERHARGRHMDRNGSGVDFLFMHRYMLGLARTMQAPPAWRHFPLPQPALEQDRLGFARYFDNHDGLSVPPVWIAPDDKAFTEGLEAMKSRDAFYSNFQVWESRFRDPEYLSRVTLGQFGTDVELNLHDWLHLCFATVPRDPTDNVPVPLARGPSDFSERWFGPQNDFLGDPFSSHVHPLFWGFHGWIDERIEDWFDAHERVHPGQVVRRSLRGSEWFAAGPWVEIDDPWLGPMVHAGDASLDHMAMGTMGMGTGMDLDKAKLAVRIAFDDKDHVADALAKAPGRPRLALNPPLRSRVGKA
jgi:uncharacterized membrane protein YphA (DoxX/SURF4 family)